MTPVSLEQLRAAARDPAFLAAVRMTASCAVVAAGKLIEAAGGALSRRAALRILATAITEALEQYAEEPEQPSTARSE